MAGEAAQALLVGLKDAVVHVRSVPLEPEEQGRTDVKTDVCEVVDDVDDSLVRPEDTRRGVTPVTLGRDLLIPVMVGKGVVFQLHFLKPGILSWRLVKMPMNAQVSVHEELLSRFPRRCRYPDLHPYHAGKLLA
jgi:hypothetical protein